MSAVRRWLSTIGGRFVAVALSIVFVTTALAAAVGAVVVTRIDDANGRRTLQVLADTAADGVGSAGSPTGSADSTDSTGSTGSTGSVGSGGEPKQDPLLAALDRPTLSALRIRVAGVTRIQGKVEVKGSPLARTALNAAQVETLLAGHEVSTRTTVEGDPVLVEARPVPGGAIILAQRSRDAATLVGRWLPRLLGLMILVALAGAALAFVMALRVARPLRALARATTDLAAGQRDLSLPTHGPAEVTALAAEFAGLTAALARSEARQREFLLSVSHDLRTPLTTITGYAEALADGQVDPDETVATGEIVLGETQRLERMVSDLLVLARLEADELPLHPQAVEVHELLRRVRAGWSAAAARQGVLLMAPPANPGGDDIWVWVDGERLRQAIDALVDNAIRVGGRGCSVVVDALAKDGHAVIEVRDDGPGLAVDDLPVAFDQGVLRERYAHERPGGAGLGLAIVRRIMARSGGSAEADGAPDGGAVFRLRLPLRAAPP